MRFRMPSFVTFALIVSALTSVKGNGPKDWPGFGNDPGGTKFSPLTATLPNDAIATPLTYMGRNGKQYVATVAGGGLDNFVRPPLEAPRPNVLVAFTLP